MGFTVPQVDEVLKPYAELSYNKYYQEVYQSSLDDLNEEVEELKKTRLINRELMDFRENRIEKIKNKAHNQAMSRIRRDMEQGFQGWEYKFNTVASSRGDYPFITMTIGLGTSEFERMASIAMLNVRGGGQGKPGRKRPVLFPKIVFLYDEEIHGKGGICRDVYDAGIKCSSKAMYPDWLSLTGEGYVASMYKKYKAVISPMGKWKYVAHIKRLEPCA